LQICNNLWEAETRCAIICLKKDSFIKKERVMKNYKGIASILVLFVVNNACARYENMPKDTTGHRMFYSTGPKSTYTPAVMPPDYVEPGTESTYTPAVMPPDYVDPNIGVYSFDAILRGGLGEPYTSKVKAIYHSGDSKRANALKKELSVAVSARYQNEAARISAVKEIIDRY
jgi:hypothetical protein